MSRRLYVRLHQPEIDALVRLAQAERRQPADQAGLLLARALQETAPPEDSRATKAAPAPVQREAV